MYFYLLQYASKFFAKFAASSANAIASENASSAATYGDGKFGFNDIFSLENLKNIEPLNIYGWSKKEVDEQPIDYLADLIKSHMKQMEKENKVQTKPPPLPRKYRKL